jgi:hypothetical protein
VTGLAHRTLTRIAVVWYPVDHRATARLAMLYEGAMQHRLV